jgi:hypothetical protein
MLFLTFSCFVQLAGDFQPFPSNTTTTPHIQHTSSRGHIPRVHTTLAFGEQSTCILGLQRGLHAPGRCWCRHPVSQARVGCAGCAPRPPPRRQQRRSQVRKVCVRSQRSCPRHGARLPHHHPPCAPQQVWSASASARATASWRASKQKRCSCCWRRCARSGRRETFSPPCRLRRTATQHPRARCTTWARARSQVCVCACVCVCVCVCARARVGCWDAAACVRRTTVSARGGAARDKTLPLTAVVR